MLTPAREAELERYLRIFCNAAFKGRTEVDAVETVGHAAAAVHSVLADAAQRWNATVQANLLPESVLSEVFMHLPCNERVQSARVCRYWRTAATSDPRLWSSLKLVSEHNYSARDDPNSLRWLNPGFLHQIMIWSGDHPIDLKIYGAYSIYLDAFCDVYPAIAGRLHSLYLEFMASAEQLARLSRVISTPAPLLADLTLMNSTGRQGLALGGQFRAPSLKSLSLQGTLPVLPDSMDPLVSVAKLVVGHQYDTNPSTSWTPRIFTLFPNLQELHIPNFGSLERCPEIHGLSHRLQSFTFGHDAPSDRIMQLPPYELHMIPRVRLMWPTKHIAKNVLAEFVPMRPRKLSILAAGWQGFRLVLSDAERGFYRECALVEKDLRRVLADVSFPEVAAIVVSDLCFPDILWPLLASLTAVTQLTILISTGGTRRMLTYVDSPAASSSPVNSRIDAIVLEEDKEYSALNNGSLHGIPFVFATDLERVLKGRIGLCISKDGSSTPKVITRGVIIKDEAKSNLRVTYAADVATVTFLL